MKFWDEELVDDHVTSGNRTALATDFLRLSRWIIAKEVRTPAWVDREDLVQHGVTLCIKAIQTRDPGKPRFRYFSQVVKNEARRYVNRACRGQLEHLPGEEHDTTPDEIVEAMIYSEAARTFPVIRDALILAHRMGRIESRSCISSLIETTGRPGEGKAFIQHLKEELT